MQKRQPGVRIGNVAPRQQQSGAILIFCLIFLAVLTMMAVSGMESSILEERMSGNFRDHTVAFQAAESALKAGETWLDGQIDLPDVSADGSTTVWTKDAPDPNPGDGNYWWEDSARGAAWWGANAETQAGFTIANSQPQYIIEHLFEATAGQSIAIGNGEVPLPRVFHRITARAEGATATAEVTLQTTFVKSYE